MQLALLIAKRVLHRELNVDTDALTAMARVAFDRLTRSESYRVSVHPQFAAAVTSALAGNSGTRIHIDPDPNCALGTLVIHSADGTIDASVETQLEEIGRGLTDRMGELRGIEMSLAIPFNLARYTTLLNRMEPVRMEGEVVELVGLIVESRGPAAAIGDFCEIRTRSGHAIRTQVIGFRDGRVLSMPLEETDGLSLGDSIIARGGESEVEVSPRLLGRVLDGFGNPIDSGPPIHGTDVAPTARGAAQPAGTRAYRPETEHRHSRHRRAAALRQRAARRHLRRERRGQEYFARFDVAIEFGRCQCHRADR